MKGHCCRKVQRRLERQVHMDEDIEECVRCLNALCSGDKVGAAKSTSTWSSAQKAALQRVENSVKQLGPPPGDRRRGATAAPRF